MGVKDIELNYKPHKKQVELHKACDVSSDHFFITCVAGRQSGKTLAGIAQLIKWVLEDDGCQAWAISPTDEQSQELYKKFYSALSGSGLIKYNTRSKGQAQITMKNGSFIKFKGARSKDSLRGVSINYLLIDEATFVEKETVEEVLLPALNVAGKKCLIATTPKGRGNWVYDFFQRGQDPNDNYYYSLKFTSYDNPEANQRYIEERKKSMPETLFDQEFNAAFVDGGTVFSNIHNLATIKKQTLAELELDPNKEYYGGIDIGLVNDFTVYTVVDEDNNMVFFEKVQRRDVQLVKNRIRQITNGINPKVTYIEVNGQGMPIYEELKKEYNNIKPFTTTDKTKQQIIHNLVNKFNTQEIAIINDEQVKNELEGYGYTVTQNGSVKFSNIGSDHDDIVMSLALANESKNKNEHTMLNDDGSLPVFFGNI